MRNFILMFAVMLCAAAPAHAARLTYEVYAGGVHVVQANLDIDLKNNTYKAGLVAATRGFLGSLVPWQGSFATSGNRRAAGAFVVHQHKSVSTWKGSDDVATYTYDKNGNFRSLKMTEDGKDKTPKDIDPKLTKGTTDILTATLNMMQTAATTNKCEGSSEVFDSRRRFTLKYQSQGFEILKSSSYNIFSGAAMKCTAEVIPNGGAWKKKPRGWLSIQEQGRKKGTMPTLWVAKISPDLPPVPVRIMIKTDYGTLFMHLASVTDPSGKKISKIAP